MELAVGEKLVGLVFTAASLLSIIVLLEMPRFLNRFGNFKTIIFLILCNSLALLSLAMQTSGWLTVISFLLYSIANTCLILSRDVFIEDYTAGEKVGRTWGAFLTIINLGLISAQLFAVYLLAKLSFLGVYSAAALVTLLSLFFIVPYLRKFKDPIYRRISVTSTVKKIYKDKNLRRLYALEFLLCFFYSWMIIYTPIYLHQHIGIEWKSLGVIFTIMLLPFILVEYPLGRLSDKVGEKKILALGFSIISIAVIGVFLLKTQNIFFWAFLLFTARLGAASVEIMNASYFFKKIGPSDAGLMSFFRNMFPLAFVIAPMIAIPILILVPAFEYLFLVLSGIMMLGFLISLRLHDLK